MEHCNTIVDKKFIHLVEELDKVVTLVGEKIEVKFRELSKQFMEVMEAEDAHWEVLGMKVTSLEEQLEHSLGVVARLAGLVTSVQAWVGDLEDVVMEESDDDAEGDVMSLLSSLTDVEPVENMVVIPVPASSVIHMLVPVKFPLEYIPPSLCSTPSPPYIQAVSRLYPSGHVFGPLFSSFRTKFTRYSYSSHSAKKTTKTSYKYKISPWY